MKFFKKEKVAKSSEELKSELKSAVENYGKLKKRIESTFSTYNEYEKIQKDKKDVAAVIDKKSEEADQVISYLMDQLQRELQKFYLLLTPLTHAFNAYQSASTEDKAKELDSELQVFSNSLKNIEEFEVILRCAITAYTADNSDNKNLNDFKKEFLKLATDISGSYLHVLNHEKLISDQLNKLSLNSELRNSHVEILLQDPNCEKSKKILAEARANIETIENNLRVLNPNFDKFQKELDQKMENRNHLYQLAQEITSISQASDNISGKEPTI